jgi:hypothetical protein
MNSKYIVDSELGLEFYKTVGMLPKTLASFIPIKIFQLFLLPAMTQAIGDL